MNRISKSIVVAAVLLVFSASAAHSASFGDIFGGKKAQEYKEILEKKEQECQQRIDEKGREYQKLTEDSKDSLQTAQQLRDKNATLMEAYEKIKVDQENALKQLKQLRLNNQQCDEIKGSYEKMTAESSAFRNEKQTLDQKMEKLKKTVANLKLHLKEVSAEKDQLAVFLAEAQEDEDVKIKNIRDQVKAETENLKKQVTLLKEENNAVALQLKESQKHLGISEEHGGSLEREVEFMRAEVASFEKQYEEIKKENLYLAKEATQFPKKFADLARHNRKLVKETADMHYNLGVSNIKAKEYKRAIKEFNKVLSLKPDDAYANYNLGYIYAEHLVDREKAIAHFQKYLTYEPKAKDANWVRKYVITWQTWYGKQTVKLAHA